MSGAQYLRQLLAPLGVYDLEGPFQNGELEALGEALDQAEAALDELHRESCLATAQDWGLERTASLFRRRPIAATPKAMREALAALLRIGGDSFTLDAINDTISGCGVHARVRETGKAGTVEVSFPKVPGIPPGFDEIQKIVEDILPAHLLVQYHFWYLTWAQLESKFSCWQEIEDKARTWTLAEQEGGAPFVECVRTVTHTCYIGDRGELHPWGYGCGQCPACKLREHGWKEYSEGK